MSSSGAAAGRGQCKLRQARDGVAQAGAGTAHARGAGATPLLAIFLEVTSCQKNILI